MWAFLCLKLALLTTISYFFLQQVLSAIISLLEQRRLFLPGRGEVIEAAPGFQLFATRSTHQHQSHHLTAGQSSSSDAMESESESEDEAVDMSRPMSLSSHKNEEKDHAETASILEVCDDCVFLFVFPSRL
jgi:midasin (ATPase involved in ribosome maturation)